MLCKVDLSHQKAAENSSFLPHLLPYLVHVGLQLGLDCQILKILFSMLLRMSSSTTRLGCTSRLASTTRLRCTTMLACTTMQVGLVMVIILTRIYSSTTPEISRLDFFTCLHNASLYSNTLNSITMSSTCYFFTCLNSYLLDSSSTRWSL